jgi:hypothetical protein
MAGRLQAVWRLNWQHWSAWLMPDAAASLVEVAEVLGQFSRTIGGLACIALVCQFSLSYFCPEWHPWKGSVGPLRPLPIFFFDCVVCTLPLSSRAAGACTAAGALLANLRRKSLKSALCAMMICLACGADVLKWPQLRREDQAQRRP